MARIAWPLYQDQPCLEVLLRLGAAGQTAVRRLLADTGAGTARTGFDLILHENDCLQGCGVRVVTLCLGGAYAGTYHVYAARVQIPALGYDGFVRSIGVPSLPNGVDGLAGFRCLNRFAYGNFGDPGQFGLEK